MKVVMILAGLTGGFFIEREVMRLTEAVVARVLRSGRMGKKFFVQIAVKNFVILLVLTLAAAWSVTLLLSLSSGMVLYTFFYVIKKNRHIVKTIKQKGSDGVWKE
ncbi:hypothetical protein KVG29_05920 [Caldicoprobacter algeriensis]|uniref:hypothetical protein n=1 Tax=Caldicoprobacter algeriensis TaxID=699281 RepID=UPI00207A03FC|nr:hypothetical protein [Caldicoprobacter algeriensis]MCM8900766.1 hypothetical protein [Caldicoprobacter algeriensis]